MGHATRSKVVLTHLVSRGHQVKILVSGRAHAYLKRFFPDVEEITGLELAMEGNRIRRTASFLKAVGSLLGGGLDRNLEVLARVRESFDADAVVSDFESIVHL